MSRNLYIEMFLLENYLTSSCLFDLFAGPADPRLGYALRASHADPYLQPGLGSGAGSLEVSLSRWF